MAKKSPLTARLTAARSRAAALEIPSGGALKLLDEAEQVLEFSQRLDEAEERVRSADEEYSEAFKAENFTPERADAAVAEQAAAKSALKALKAESTSKRAEGLIVRAERMLTACEKQDAEASRVLAQRVLTQSTGRRISL